MKFTELGLSEPLLKAIELQGYDSPSPIQLKAIPHALEGRDVMAAAQTGTGKTAGFTLPILHRLSNSSKPTSNGNQARALILTPTRELAAQVAASVETYGQNLKIKSVVVFGGVKINPQMQKLRGGTDVLIATPGRLLDLQSQNAVQLDKLEILVLDEADRMLDMGFIHDIRRILKLIPKKRQTLLFSATFSNEIRELAKKYTYKPIEVSVSPPNTTVETVKQSVIAVEKTDKTQILTRLIQENDWFQVLVFSRTKHGANKLVKKLITRDIEASAIHGNKSQGARTRALAEFKEGKCRVLVATDIAARGIDIDQLPHVVNFDLPQVAEDYVHRIGRTGRAGASGEAISLVSHDEAGLLRDIERLIKLKIPRKQMDGYEPLNSLPESLDRAANTQTKKPNNRKNRSRKRGAKSGSKSNQTQRNENQTSKRNQNQTKGNNKKGSGNGKGSKATPNRSRSHSGRGNGNRRAGNKPIAKIG
ncbi:MAG: DEAD/DEAH box helicase [Acidiferrobacterales bacterium]|nr:DEAD/DEAH box helicase [Acidiferrobacterales bacterium]